jgi:hypothetical protein
MRSVENPLEVRYATNACHDRLCVPCAADRSRVITHQVLELLAGEPTRFVTLTLAGGEPDLGYGIWRLLRSFRRLRQRTFWKHHVRGGVYFVEFTRSANTHAWHVHLHCITHGRYVDQAKLSREWHAVTRDSYICHVEYVRSERKIVNYVAKYVTKPWDRDAAKDDALLDQIVAGTHRKRLVGGFGDWKDVAVTRRPEAGKWIIVGDIETIVDRARAGDDDALWLLGAALGDAEDTLLAKFPESRGPPASPATPAQPHQLAFSWPIIDSRF